MFSPRDEGLQRPLELKVYNGRHVICDKDGRELFTIDVVIPSREAWDWLREWGEDICDKFNSVKKNAKKLSD